MKTTLSKPDTSIYTPQNSVLSQSPDDTDDFDLDHVINILQEDEQVPASNQMPSQQHQNGNAPYVTREDKQFGNALVGSHLLSDAQMKQKHEEIAQKQNTFINSNNFQSSSKHVDVQNLKRGANADNYSPEIAVEKKQKIEINGEEIQQQNVSKHHFPSKSTTDDNKESYQIAQHQPCQGHQIKLVHKEDLPSTSTKPINKTDYLIQSNCQFQSVVSEEPARQPNMIYAKNPAVGAIPGSRNNGITQTDLLMLNGSRNEQSFLAFEIKSSNSPLLGQYSGTGTSSVVAQADSSVKSGGSKDGLKSAKVTKQPNPNYIFPPGKKRARFAPDALLMFQKSFEFDPHPDKMERERLAQQANVCPRQVQIWFQNMRNKLKTKQACTPQLSLL